MIIKHGILFNFSRGQYLQDEEKPSYIAMSSAQSGFSELSEDSHINQKETTSTPLANLAVSTTNHKQAELHNNGRSHW